MGVLPGLGEYDSDSSSLSDDSSEEDEDGAPSVKQPETSEIFNRKTEQISAAHKLSKC